MNEPPEPGIIRRELLELFWAGKGRGRRAYSATARAMRDANGTFLGAVIAFTDVTGLINALTVKDKFVATISHELRTPLTSILGFLELIIDEPDAHDTPAQLAIVERNARRLLTLVNDLLLVASDGLDVNPREVDFSDILKQAVQVAGPDASANGVEIKLEPGGPLPALLDPGLMVQTVENLLSNAIKFSPFGGRVTVAGTTVTFTVPTVPAASG